MCYTICMICNNFQKKHLIAVLKGFNLGSIPLDLFMYRYFKNNRSLGANDRRVINRISYEIVKNLCFVEERAKKPLSWESRIDAFLSFDIEDEILHEKKLCMHKQVSMPLWLFEKLKANFGLDKAVQISHILRQKAPVFIRTNTLKVSREDLFQALKNDLNLELVKDSKTAMKVLKPAQFKAFNEYLDGHFEVQDLSSQFVTENLYIKGDERILDFCAGSGGKSLHLAARLKNKGQVNLYDIREKALINAKSRLKKAGAFNTKIYFESSKLRCLKNKMDIVFTDVPCSGSGTFRRNPEQKYRLTKEKLDELVKEQRNIVAEAIKYLKPRGRLVYATCSILSQENEEQITYFKKHFNLIPKTNSTQILPQENGADGFFFCEMQFNS